MVAVLVTRISHRSCLRTVADGAVESFGLGCKPGYAAFVGADENTLAFSARGQEFRLRLVGSINTGDGVTSMLLTMRDTACWI